MRKLLQLLKISWNLNLGRPERRASCHASGGITRPPTAFDFDYNTITVSQAWPWLKGVILILIGCVMAIMIRPLGKPPCLHPPPLDFEI